MSPEQIAEIDREAKGIVERAARETKRVIADLEANRGPAPKETLTADQLRAAIIEAVNDGDSADAVHYALRWRRLPNGEVSHAAKRDQLK